MNNLDFEEIYHNQKDNYNRDICEYEKFVNNWNPITNENEKDNNNEEQNFSFGNKLHIYNNNTILTNTSIAIDEEKEISRISFFSVKNKNEDNNTIKNKEISKESIEILENYITKENMIISEKNINEKVIYNNKNIKNIKKHLFSLDDKINLYFQNPYMRKNLKKLKEINTNTNVYKEEKIKYNEGNIKMKNIKECHNYCE